MNLDALKQAVAAGLVTERPHPRADLLIYNYTARCAYERAWAPETLAARGLILDKDGRIVARPFPKFFNLGEPGAPEVAIGEPFEATEKLDGSLGIAYRNPDTGCSEIATRGSFASEQARWATRWWELNGADIPDGQTWLFEIIYPENRIVVNYGDRAELVLLSVRETATGAELPLPEWGGANVPRYDAETVDELLANASGGDREGYVICFPRTGERVKVKLDEYVRLHRVLTGCSARSIWECLSMGQSLDPLLDRVPDEFFAWVRDRERELSRRFGEIRDSCAEIMRDPRVVRDDRKTTAEFFKAQPYPAVLFRMLDGKDCGPLIWKLIRPEHAVPFRRDEV